MDVGIEQEPAEGETVVLTDAGGFQVKGSMREVADRIAGEEWVWLELAESGDRIMLRSDKVVALRGGTGKKRSVIGLTPH